MGTIYRSEISFDGVIMTPVPDPTIVTIVGVGPNTNVFYGGVAFMVGDGAANKWAIFAGVGVDQTGGGVTEFQAGYELVYQENKAPFFLDGPNPINWTQYTVRALLQDPAGSAGSGYLSGGTIAVVKDFANNQITMVTPIGSVTRTLNENDAHLANSALNDTYLIPIGQEMHFTIPQDGVHSPANIDCRARFFNMYAKRDGAIFYGHALGSSDPGGYQVGVGETVDTTGATAGLFPPFTPWFTIAAIPVPQRAQFEGQVSAASYPVGPPALNSFDVYRYTDEQPPAENAIDLELAEEHGVVWRGGPDINYDTQMQVARTFDNAQSWVSVVAFSDVTSANSSPTLSWYNQRLYLTWHDGTNIRESRSQDGGFTWEMPTTLPFTGTHPRRVIDRTGGGSFYFSFNGGGDLVCYFSYDGGATFEGPFTVVLAAGTQQIDAEFVPDGSLVVAVNVAGVLKQYRSRDLGRTWA